MVWSAHWVAADAAMYCVARDGREKQADEEALRQSNERFQLASPFDALYDWNIETNELYWGQGLWNTFGYRSHEVQIGQWATLIEPVDKKPTIQRLASVLHDPFIKEWHAEYRFKKANGTYCHVLEQATILRNEKGTATRMVGMLHDITESKLREASIRHADEKYRLLFQKSPFPIFIYSLETLRFRDVNDAAVQLYGYSKEEFLAMTVMDIRPEEDKPKMKEALDLVWKQDKVFYQGQFRHKTKSGAIIIVDVTTHEIQTAAGRKVIATINNITDKVRLKERIIEEKLAAQKEKARAIIATEEKERNEIGKELHDNVNQLLTTAKLYVENITYYPEQASQFLQKSTEILQKSINEIRFLSKALVTPTIRDLGFKETLQELIDAYLELNTFSIHPTFSFEEACIEKEIKLTLYRILQEALNNTVKYAKASEVLIKIKQLPTKVKMTYLDNGVGFDIHLQKTGLGLRNIQNRVEVYKGTVLIRSAPGKGSCIEVNFPL
jgi:PAS domain S-box-containing protein